MAEQRRRAKGTYLLVALVLLLVSLPLVQDARAGLVILQLLFTGVLIAGMYAASASPLLLLGATGLAVPALVSNWTRGAGQDPIIMAVGLVGSIGLLGLAGWAIISTTVRHPRVTRDTIYAALAVYLLIGLAFAFCYSLITMKHPDAFRGPGGASIGPLEAMATPAQFSSVVYYSLITLTTLGYGDILPVRPEARLLSSLEAVFGQFYVATVIGWLVGRQVSQSIVERAQRAVSPEHQSHKQEIT